MQRRNHPAATQPTAGHFRSRLHTAFWTRETIYSHQTLQALCILPVRKPRTTKQISLCAKLYISYLRSSNGKPLKVLKLCLFRLKWFVPHSKLSFHPFYLYLSINPQLAPRCHIASGGGGSRLHTDIVVSGICIRSVCVIVSCYLIRPSIPLQGVIFCHISEQFVHFAVLRSCFTLLTANSMSLV